MKTLILGVLLCSAAGVRAAPPMPSYASAAAPKTVAVSTAAAAASAAPAASALIGVSTFTVSMLYTGDRVRDPFLAASAGAVVQRRREEGPLVVDIHNLQLRGIMEDTTGDYAVFVMDGGISLLMRHGKVYDDRNKLVPGITGRIKMKQKRVELITSDRDVQVFTLGEVGDKDKS